MLRCYALFKEYLSYKLLEGKTVQADMINVIIHVIGGNNTNISALTKKLFLLQLIKNTLHLAVLLLYIISKCESSDLTDSEKNIGRGRHKYEIVIKPEAMQRKTEHEHKKPPKNKTRYLQAHGNRWFHIRSYFWSSKFVLPLKKCTLQLLNLVAEHPHLDIFNWRF